MSSGTGIIKSQQLTLEFRDLSYKVPYKESIVGPFVRAGKETVSLATNYTTSCSQDHRGRQYKPILHDVSGVFKPGELTCILGPSGSGKSTLLNVLAGYRTKNVDGAILVNGKTRDASWFRKQSRYIMQQSVLLDQLTVKEAMGFAAELKLPPSSSKVDKRARVAEILGTIGLTDCAVSSTRTCELSGGEKKRLAIALELITNPPVMFLDEPTTGLDSYSAISCINLLHKLTSHGNRTIIASIHQPSSRIFELFDSMYLLSEGRCLYSGKRAGFVEFLANQQIECPMSYNPADFAIEIASFEYGQEPPHRLAKATQWLQKNRPDADKMIELESSLNHIDYGSTPAIDNFCSQFSVLTRRSFICIRRDFMLVHLRFIATLAIGLLVGLMFHNVGNDANMVMNNVGANFFGLLFLTFSAMVTILTFPLEREVFIREHLNGWYSTKAFYVARTLADMPFQILFPTFFTCITYVMTDQPLESFRFSLILLISILVSLIGWSVGTFTAVLFDIQTAVFVAPMSTLPIILFSGALGSMTSIPAYLSWLRFISFMRFTLHGIVNALYGHDRGFLPCNQPVCLFKDPEKFLQQMEMNDVNLIAQIVYLCITLVILRVAAYFALRYKVKSRGDDS